MILLQCKKTGEIIELREEIAKSGEGRIYQTSKDGFLAKIYHSITQEQLKYTFFKTKEYFETITLSRF